MNAWPDISVVIPTHRRPHHLVRAVESVMAQDYPGRIECLIVFDREKPYLPPVKVQPKRHIEIMANGRTPGLAGARNTGILAARGEWVAFLDDDDVWLSSKLSRQVAWSREHPAGLVGCGIIVDFRGHQTTRIPSLEGDPFRALLRSRHMALHPSTFLIPKDVLTDTVGLIDETIPGAYGEDYDWLLRASRLVPFTWIPEPLVRVSWGQSLFTGRWETFVQAHEYLLQKHPFKDDPRSQARICGQIAFAYGALGKRRHALQWAKRSLSSSPLEPRGYLAMLLATGALRASWVMNLAHRFGRGI